MKAIRFAIDAELRAMLVELRVCFCRWEDLEGEVEMTEDTLADILSVTRPGEEPADGLRRILEATKRITH